MGFSPGNRTGAVTIGDESINGSEMPDFSLDLVSNDRQTGLEALDYDIHNYFPQHSERLTAEK